MSAERPPHPHAHLLTTDGSFSHDSAFHPLDSWDGEGVIKLFRERLLALDIVDVETGQSRRWKELLPPDPAGVSTVEPILVSTDGRSHVYSYRRVLDRLTVVEELGRSVGFGVRSE